MDVNIHCDTCFLNMMTTLKFLHEKSLNESPLDLNLVLGELERNQEVYMEVKKLLYNYFKSFKVPGVIECDKCQELNHMEFDMEVDEESESESELY